MTIYMCVCIYVYTFIFKMLNGYSVKMHLGGTRGVTVILLQKSILRLMMGHRQEKSGLTSEARRRVIYRTSWQERKEGIEADSPV